jgi:hypothetical protein
MVKPLHATYPPHAGRSSIVVIKNNFENKIKQGNNACLLMSAVSVEIVWGL